MKAVVEEELGEEMIAVAALSQGKRVVALRGTEISDEDGNSTGAAIRGEIASWPRGEVTAVPASADEGSKGGTLQIPGASIPVFTAASATRASASSSTLSRPRRGGRRC